MFSQTLHLNLSAELQRLQPITRASRAAKHSSRIQGAYETDERAHVYLWASLGIGRKQLRRSVLLDLSHELMRGGMSNIVSARSAKPPRRSSEIHNPRIRRWLLELVLLRWIFVQCQCEDMDQYNTINGLSNLKLAAVSAKTC